MAEEKKLALVNMVCEYTRKSVVSAFSKYEKFWQVSQKKTNIKTAYEGGDNEKKFSFGGRTEESDDEGEEKEENFDEGWEEDYNNADFFWTDYEQINWDRTIQGRSIANAYLIRKGLIRKAQLAFNVSKYVSKHPDSNIAKGFPQTFTLELDHPDYLDEALYDIPEVQNMEPGSKVWILKPSMCNQGSGIHLFDSVDELQSIFESNDYDDIREWVIQDYIADPLLIDQRKFHIRAYVLAIGSLKVYLYDEMLTLFSLQEYPSDQTIDISDLAAHITNTCYQKKGDDVEFEEEKAVKLFSELESQLGGKEKAQFILESIRKITSDTFASCSGEVGFFPLPNCFEFFGLDFLIEKKGGSDDLQVYLLEVNAEPDFMQTGDRLRSLIDNLLNEATEMVLRHFYSQKPETQTEDKKFTLVYEEDEKPYMQAGGQSLKLQSK